MLLYTFGLHKPTGRGKRVIGLNLVHSSSLTRLHSKSPDDRNIYTMYNIHSHSRTQNDPQHTIPEKAIPRSYNFERKKKSHSRYRVKGKLHKMQLCQGNKKKRKTSVVSIFFFLQLLATKAAAAWNVVLFWLHRRSSLLTAATPYHKTRNKKKKGMNVPLNAVSQDLETARTLRANLNLAAVPLRAHHGPLANCYDRLLFGPLYS